MKFVFSLQGNHIDRIINEILYIINSVISIHEILILVQYYSYGISNNFHNNCESKIVL
jgi:hypothetical protein